MIRFPQVEPDTGSREFQEEFKGYNNNLRISESEFHDMQNMTGDFYPVLSPRKKRGILKQFNKFNGIICKEKLCYVDGATLYIGDTAIDCLNLSDSLKNLVSMGAYLIIFPDKVYINTQKVNNGVYEEYGNLEFERTIDSSVNNVTFEICTSEGKKYTHVNYVGDASPNTQHISSNETWYCTLSGKLYFYNDWEENTPIWDNYEVKIEDNLLYIGNTFPENTTNIPDGLIWQDTSGETFVLKKWSNSSRIWTPIATSYIKISSQGMVASGKSWTKDFSIGDIIAITGCKINDSESEVIKNQISTLNNYHAIVTKGDDYLIISGILNKSLVQVNGNIILKRTVPNMDYVIESNNRLWGCRYGEQICIKDDIESTQFVNEIYCCKQGDFKNWRAYEGISTDSYAVSLGSDGPFTGAVVYGGYPTFFKENSIHKIYGNMPSNYQVLSQNARGIEKGSEKSVCILNEMLFYKSSSDICIYDGTLPISISNALGSVKYKNAVAGAVNNKFYISMQDYDDKWHMFVYDITTQMWHKEDDTHALTFFNEGIELYFVDAETEKIFSATGTTAFKTISGNGSQESDFEWYAETGAIGYSYSDNKYVGRMLLRLQKPVTSQLRVRIKYDNNDCWENIATIGGYGTNSYSLPVIPRRCDHFAIRIEGKGDCKIFSLSKVIEIGSDC